MLALSSILGTALCSRCEAMIEDESMLAERTDRGNDSREPPNKDEGARARIEASVSIDLLRRRLEEEARVRIDALSVSRLLAVAVAYVAGCPPLLGGAMCAGRAFGGGEVGNWCEKCILFAWPAWWVLGAGGTADWMVVNVVVRLRTLGAGDENVESPPRPDIPQPAVPFVVSPDEGASCEPAASECAGPEIEVDRVGATDLFPMVGGRPSREEWRERLLRSRDVWLMSVPVGTVEKERFPFCRWTGLIFPDPR
jgi:hypothetical protein